MNGIHDLGGMDGLGPIEREENEPVFHEPWEARVFALTIAMGGQLPATLDEWRHMRERMDPVTYLDASYYEHWRILLERQVFAAGLVTPSQIETRMADLAKEAP
ncbi:MAG: hypothetical protein ACE5GS_08060 [Kiloniellaceae bacterium]